MRKEAAIVRSWNRTAKSAAQKVIKARGQAGSKKELKKSLETANRLGDALNDWVYGETKTLLSAGKIVGVVGGDHSVPYGAYRAVGEAHGPFSLLHFDAHSDTRASYQGLTWSHASIMRNALTTIPHITRITQVGIRDYCEEEHDFLKTLGPRASVFFDHVLAARRFAGKPWDETASEIVATLSEKVWVSFDIDALDPKLCPHTGTPVPGGLDFNEAVRLIALTARSGRTIVGFDLVEVAPGGRSDWDANVGMRLLYKLATWTFLSRGLCALRG